MRNPFSYLMRDTLLTLTPVTSISHCHILQHMVMGMQMVWVMGDYEQIAKIPEPYASGYLTFGGSAYGNETFAPSYIHQFD